MGVVFTHGVTYDTGAFPVGAVETDTQLVHVVEGSPLYGLQAVSYVRECSGYDYAHGVVDVGFLH